MLITLYSPTNIPSTCFTPPYFLIISSNPLSTPSDHHHPRPLKLTVTFSLLPCSVILFSPMALWTEEQNKRFEQLLAVYDKDTPDRWQNVARGVGKSVEDVKRQYRKLEEDVRHIESGNFSSYSQNSFGTRGEEQRLRYLRLYQG